MASKRRQRRRQCERKEGLTKDAAFRIAVKLRKKSGTTVDAYPCPNCGKWHVGHRPRKVQQSIGARRRASEE